MPLRALLALVASLLGLSAAAAEAQPLNRENLLEYRTPDGTAVPVRTVADWQHRRAEIVAGMQTLMGPFPSADKRVPLEVKIESETDCGYYVRREITYTAEPGSRTPAFLLLPKAVLTGQVERPGILALMGTSAEGNRLVVGLGKQPVKRGRNYAEELVWRGYVVIAPAYPYVGPYKPDIKALGYTGGTMKAIWDNIRALDVLEATPGVAKTGFGAIGLSLGGHNSIYTAVFDERIKAVVSSCGFDAYADYHSTRPDMWRPGMGWAQECYMPVMASYANRKQELPVDFHEMIAALAPRAFFAHAPRQDANFKWQSVARVITAASTVYTLHGVPERIDAVHPEGIHDFPREWRERAYAWLERFVGPGDKN